MIRRRRFPNLSLPEDRGPLRVMFVHTEVVVGGAETLLAELMRHMDPDRFEVELVCLKRLAELGEVLVKEFPTHVGLLKNKYDVGVLWKLARLLKRQRIDAVVTVGTGGDRMFWGRLAAWRAGVPVILSSLHSTGHPVCVERLNRWLAPISDGFIGCARMHSQFLVTGEGCPPQKVFTICNGVDTDRYRPQDRDEARRRFGLPIDAPTAGIVAALRPEKQHLLLLEAMRLVVHQIPQARLVILGDGVERPHIEAKIDQLGLRQHVDLPGMRQDVPAWLPALDVKVLSSKMEANPASTLEAASCGLPVVAPDVGSLPETVLHGETGLLYPADDSQALASSMVQLLSDPAKAHQMGAAGRELVCRQFSLSAMVRGYEVLIEGIYRAACNRETFTPERFDQQMSELFAEGSPALA